ncbi:MAG: tyrosine-type recombinase/integrase [Actinomycetota bacterium]|nr:tyrosine-type recombinase/integrase [Actinomycetota bacterium]
MESPATDLEASAPALPVPLLEVSEHARAAAAGWLVGYSGRTRVEYARDLADFAGWCTALGLDLLEVHRSHVELYTRHLEAAGRAAATVARRLSAVSSFYRWLTDEELLQRSPTTRVRRPRIRREPASAGLSGLEAARLLDVADQLECHRDRDAALIGLLLIQGLRVSEAISIRFCDLGEDRGYTTVTITRKGGERVVVPLHTRVAPHVAGLVELARNHPQAIAFIDEYEEGTYRYLGTKPMPRPLLHATADEPYSDEDWRLVDGVWRGVELPPGLTRHAARRIVVRVARRAGITRPVAPHTLRHSFVALSLDAGVPLPDVQDAAGHKDPRTTQIYDRLRGQYDRHPMHPRPLPRQTAIAVSHKSRRQAFGMTSQCGCATCSGSAP